MTQKGNVVYAEKQGDGVSVIFLNQPKKKNAISAEMMDELVLLLGQADADNEVRAVILRGAGDNFSSGGDLNQSTPEENTPENARKTLRRYLAVIRSIRRTAKPIIAQVDGYAVGGAFALTLACDLVCASDRAVFVPAFCQIGIIPEMGMMKYLPELVGPQRAKEILFIGERMSADELRALGLVNRVFAADQLERESLAFAKRVASMPDASIQITKGIMNSIADENLEMLLEAESTASPFCTTTKAYATTMERFVR